MNYKETFFNILNTYFLFGLIYSGVIWLIWSFLFVDYTGVSLSFLQVFAIYVIARILVGNSSTQYISNFYSPKPLNIENIDKTFDEIIERFNNENDSKRD